MASSGNDSLRGSGELTVGDARLVVHVSARSGPSGEDASGTIHIDQTGEHTLSGVADLICLHVDGDRATAAGRLRHPVPNPNAPGQTYQYVIVWVTDDGSPGHGDDILNSGVHWGVPGGATVPSCLTFVGGLPSERGNLTVSDATP